MEPRRCECCTTAFSEGEGLLGDICHECGWECDMLEEDGYSSANGSTLEEFRAAMVREVPALVLTQEDLGSVRIF